MNAMRNVCASSVHGLEGTRRETVDTDCPETLCDMSAMSLSIFQYSQSDSNKKKKKNEGKHCVCVCVPPPRSSHYEQLACTQCLAYVIGKEQEKVHPSMDGTGNGHAIALFRIPKHTRRASTHSSAPPLAHTHTHTHIYILKWKMKM